MSISRVIEVLFPSPRLFRYLLMTTCVVTRSSIGENRIKKKSIQEYIVRAGNGLGSDWATPNLVWATLKS